MFFSTWSKKTDKSFPSRNIVSSSLYNLFELYFHLLLLLTVCSIIWCQTASGSLYDIWHTYLLLVICGASYFTLTVGTCLLWGKSSLCQVLGIESASFKFLFHRKLHVIVSVIMNLNNFKSPFFFLVADTLDYAQGFLCHRGHLAVFEGLCARDQTWVGCL